MNADRVVTTPAAKAPRQALGSVVIGLQCTPRDTEATLRVFARCDTVFCLLATELALDSVPAARPDGVFFCPPVLEAVSPEKRYLLSRLHYDSAGRRVDASLDGIVLDLREGAKILIPSGMHAGATGEVEGYDREGNPRCRFMVRLKKGRSFKAAHMMVLGTWWLQSAADCTCARLPIVNVPEDDDFSAAACEMRTLCEEY